jgi:hypothetical protein
MSALADCRGVPVSSTDRSALDGLERASARLNRFEADPVAEIETTLAAHPHFIMGHCLRAALMAAATQRDAVAEARRSLDAAIASPATANARERGHIAALTAWVAGDWDGASDRYDRVVAEFPCDLIALQMAHQLHFFTGRRAALRDLPQAALPHWDAGMPGLGHVHGMLAFGLEENGAYAAAERIGRQAVEADAADAWAVHAVAHVMEMQGRTQDGIAWLGATAPHWGQGNMLGVHNWWHLALLHLDRGETDAVLRLYDTRVRAARSAVALELLDASALLWRLKLQGVDTGDRFAALADDWAPLLEDGWYAFNDVFAMVALAGAGRLAEGGRLLARMEQSAQGAGTNAVMTRAVGLPLARGMLAFAHGAPAMAIRHMLPAREGAIRFGGSNAQRDIIDWTLLEAALRVGDRALAAGLAEARAAAKPHSPIAQLHQARAAALPVAA